MSEQITELDKLWENRDDYDLVSFLSQVKAEVDKLQEENKAITSRMDSLQFCLDHCAETTKEQQQKLEAVRGFCAEAKKSMAYYEILAAVTENILEVLDDV